eukprot:Phypoly_transcript_23150.p1 GENE.Phypoly_transcript_23150~~Phypoly_transcript_23150.p1  ORF type:complete len:111 (-),score=7.97 Phypoly_transcript_23150:75-407(-)
MVNFFDGSFDLLFVGAFCLRFSFAFLHAHTFRTSTDRLRIITFFVHLLWGKRVKHEKTGKLPSTPFSQLVVRFSLCFSLCFSFCFSLCFSFCFCLCFSLCFELFFKLFAL